MIRFEWFELNTILGFAVEVANEEVESFFILTLEIEDL